MEGKKDKFILGAKKRSMKEILRKKKPFFFEKMTEDVGGFRKIVKMTWGEGGEVKIGFLRMTSVLGGHLGAIHILRKQPIFPNPPTHPPCKHS